MTESGNVIGKKLYHCDIGTEVSTVITPETVCYRAAARVTDQSARASNIVYTELDEFSIKRWVMYVNFLIWVYDVITLVHSSGYSTFNSLYNQNEYSLHTDGDNTLQRYYSYDGIDWAADITGSVWKGIAPSETEARNITTGSLPLPYLIIDASIIKATEV